MIFFWTFLWFWCGHLENVLVADLCSMTRAVTQDILFFAMIQFFFCICLSVNVDCLSQRYEIQEYFLLNVYCIYRCSTFNTRKKIWSVFRQNDLSCCVRSCLFFQGINCISLHVSALWLKVNVVYCCRVSLEWNFLTFSRNVTATWILRYWPGQQSLWRLVEELETNLMSLVIFITLNICSTCFEH